MVFTSLLTTSLPGADVEVLVGGRTYIVNISLEERVVLAIHPCREQCE